MSGMNGNNVSFGATAARWLQARGSTLLRNAAGKPQYVTSLTEDITERKRAEEKLRDSEELFRSIFENAPVGISLYKVDGSQYFTNSALQKMVGYTHEDLSSLDKWDQIVHPDERASRAERMAGLIRGERDIDAWEQRFLHRDGRIVVTHRNCSVVRDLAGKPQYLLNMTTDITEHKRAQEERDRVAKQMEMLLESTGQGIYGIDLQGNCTFINRATCELIGYRPEEALGRNMHESSASPQTGWFCLSGGSMPGVPRTEEGRGLRLERRSHVAARRHSDPG